MAFSIGRQQTVLWDSISYSGNPKEFAYVLPAKPGTRLEPSNEAFFAALDASTRPIIMAPQSTGYGGDGGYGGHYGGYGADDYYGGGGGGGGCCGSTTASASFSGAPSSAYPGAPGADAAPPAPPPVQIVDQAVVGPYETITVRSTKPEALDEWLKEHGYAIPPSSGPIIASYVKEGYDFIALRLRPGSDVRAMQPIRIVSPGADTTLPLRLMQIGAGAQVGITLYLLGEGRYRTANFPEVPLELSKLIWDWSQNRSNYQALAKAAMATEGGRAFITEYANHPSFELGLGGRGPGLMGNPGLLDAYATACPTYGVPRPPPVDAGSGDGGRGDAGDAGRTDLDASLDPDASLDSDAGDAGEVDAGPPREVKTYCDDIDVAFAGMTRKDVWVTRMRADLPNAALDATLLLEASPKQETVENVHQTTATGTVTAQIAPGRGPSSQGTYAVLGLAAFAVTRLARRRSRSE